VAYFLGVDGGASKTSSVLGDDRTILGRGTAGSSNVTRVGEAAARESLTVSILQACAAAQISPKQITSTCVGAAGAARENVRAQLQRSVREIVQGEVQIVGDMVIALQAAFGNGPGVIVVAGSGSIAYGRDVSGATVRAGGWGFRISDEGSGYWIGRKAIAASLRVCDERGEAECRLLSEILKVFALQTREQLVVKANGDPPPDFASLVPAVISLSDHDDEGAQAVLRAAGEELGKLAVVVIKRLFADATSVPVAMSGGVFANSALLRQVFYNYLSVAFPAAVTEGTVVEPALGALELARKRVQV
jgi:glucosamine kinase